LSIFRLCCSAACVGFLLGLAIQGCATQRVRVSFEGVFEDTVETGPAPLNKNAFKSEVDIAEGQSATVNGTKDMVVRISPKGVTADTATFDLQVSRIVQGGEKPLANSRVLVQLGQRVVLESRAPAGTETPGMRYFRFALVPRLLD